MKVLLFGSGQTQYISKIYREAGHQTRILDRDNLRHRLLALRDILWCDTLYLVSGRDLTSVKLLRLAMMLKKKFILHWIGTDVLQATEAFRENQKVMNEQYPHIDLVCAQHLQTELLQIGVQALYVPIVPLDMKFEALEPPKTHAVLSYIPHSRESFYGMEKLKALAKRHPEIPFYIVANNGENDTDKLPNVHYQGTVGRQEMMELYRRCSILLRYPEHDGLSMMLIEALGLGRQVIYSYPFPCVLTPNDNSDEAINSVFQEILSAPPKVNREGSEYVRQQYSNEKLLERYKEIGVI